MGSILCEHCSAACCRYIAIPLEKPKTARDYDDIRWYLMHQNVLVFVEEGKWYIQFQTRCKNLGGDYRCTIYDVRPAICAEYEPGDCDYAGGDYGYDHLFTHAKQVEEFYLNKTGKPLPSMNRNGAASRRKRPRRAVKAPC